MDKFIRRTLEYLAHKFSRNPLAQTVGGTAEGEDNRDPKFQELMCEAGSEGIVLLENNGILPLEENKCVSVFGRVAHNYMYCGYGSGGDVRTNTCTNLIEGLRQSNHIKINEDLAKIYKDFAESKKGYIDDQVWGRWPRYYKEMPLTKDIVAKAKECSDTAIVVIGRAAGEDRENILDKGGFYLLKEEFTMLDLVTDRFDNVIVIINAGNVVDLSWTEQYKNKISALLYAWQGGEQSGPQIANILSGKVNPSGKLTDTIAKNYEDYISSKNFGDKKANIYFEDIFVGYRYFETFAKDKVMYPFGYGLSYTDFDISASEFDVKKDTITINATIKNTGKLAGKEAVCVYVVKPDADLPQSAIDLVDFEKTDVINPGEEQIITFKINENQITSFDDVGKTAFKNSFILCKGTYEFYIGTSVRDITKAGEFVQAETAKVKHVEPVLPLENPITRLSYKKQNDILQESTEQVNPETPILKQRILNNLPKAISQTKKNYNFKQVLDNEISLEDFVASLSIEELEDLSRGEGMMHSPLGMEGNAGAYGGISKTLQEKGIPAVITADGPAGLRLKRYGSLLPCGTQLACTFNKKLIQKLFEELGKEMAAYGVDVILSPGMNIHRNPLGGRNFEYYSEDPVVSGKIASSAVQGIQTNGFSACPKHFAFNNQETGRNNNNSILSERAMREIYLKGFEICVKESNPKNLMVAYNKGNGVWCHYSYDLAQRVLRDEWGYEGLVITDWWMQPSASQEFPQMKDNAYRVRGSVDVLMPGGKHFYDHSKASDSTLIATYGQKEGITLGEMQRTAIRVLKVCKEKLQNTPKK